MPLYLIAVLTGTVPGLMIASELDYHSDRCEKVTLGFAFAGSFLGGGVDIGIRRIDEEMCRTYTPG